MKTLAATTLLLASKATAMIQSNQLVPPPLKDHTFGLDKRATTQGQGTFQQLIDHSDPSLGTFPQRFWWSSEFWAGPGSPVVFMTPGESAADGYTGYLTNRTITGLFAQAIGGAVVMMEHRYWGTSSPFDKLTTKNLRYLTLENSIHDTTYFARNVKFPFDPNSTSTATKAPWVMSGGSYSGALTAWVESKDPGTFWAYHASSAVVQTVGDFWEYFAPVQKGMPQNCSADVSKVIEYVDKTLKEGSDSDKHALKDKFGLAELEHDDDFASALENGPWAWQSHDFDTGYTGFDKFCDYVENAIPATFPNSTGSPGAGGVGLEKALSGYAKWSREVMIPGTCSNFGYWQNPMDLGCFDTYNASNPMFTDVTLANTIDRQWQWFLCNEPFKYWQDGAPAGTSTIVSRLVNSAYWERQCALFFPPEDGYTYGIAKGKSNEDVNSYTGGWDHVNTTRLIWANGEFDPWKDSTVSSDFRPGGPLKSTHQAPVNVIPGGIHCSDLILRNGQANAGVMKVINDEVEVIKGWVKEYARHKHDEQQ